MHEAAQAGVLDVCRYLFENGVSETIRTRSKDRNGNYGWTPMFAACSGGHLHVAQWLFVEGADADIKTKIENCQTQMNYTFARSVLNTGLGPGLLCSSHAPAVT